MRITPELPVAEMFQSVTTDVMGLCIGRVTGIDCVVDTSVWVMVTLFKGEMVATLMVEMPTMDGNNCVFPQGLMLFRGEVSWMKPAPSHWHHMKQQH